MNSVCSMSDAFQDMLNMNSTERHFSSGGIMKRILGTHLLLQSALPVITLLSILDLGTVRQSLHYHTTFDPQFRDCLSLFIYY